MRLNLVGGPVAAPGTECRRRRSARHDDEAMRSRISWLMVLTVWQMLLQRDFEPLSEQH